MFKLFKRLRSLEDRIAIVEHACLENLIDVSSAHDSIESFVRYTSTVPTTDKSGNLTRKKVSKKKVEEHLDEHDTTFGTTEDF